MILEDKTHIVHEAVKRAGSLDKLAEAVSTIGARAELVSRITKEMIEKDAENKERFLFYPGTGLELHNERAAAIQEASVSGKVIRYLREIPSDHIEEILASVEAAELNDSISSEMDENEEVLKDTPRRAKTSRSAAKVVAGEKPEKKAGRPAKRL